MKLSPTRRSVIEPSYKCNIKCRFCYHLHKDWEQYDKSLDELKKEVDDSYNRGNDYIDITGGEPTIYPQIVELVKYIKSKDMGCCIITNGLCGPIRTQELIDVGVDDFLVSVHNINHKHDIITNCSGSRDKQDRFINQIKGHMSFRVNVVINTYNQEDLYDISKHLITLPVSIVNFISPSSGVFGWVI